MTKPDDSALAPADLRAVEERARNLLDRADAWDRFPVPVEDILAAAKVHVAPNNAFDFDSLLSYITDKPTHNGVLIKSAISKVCGIYDAGAGLIHIGNSMVQARRAFLILHEVGHHDLPTHRKMYRFFQDCSKTLAPEIVDQFEREANNFARYILFKGDRFADHAADSPLGIQTPITLARKFGASVYASAREFTRTNRKPCVLLVFNPLKITDTTGLHATLRRIEASPSFLAQFGSIVGDGITPDHFLWPAVPICQRMTGPLLLSIPDRNGVQHECVAEALDTTYNILVLLYSEKTLTTKRVVLPI